jgi:hypothetical protein
MGHGIEDDVDAHGNGGGGLVGFGARLGATEPAGLQVVGAVDDAQIPIDRDAFEHRRLQVR